MKKLILLTLLITLSVNASASDKGFLSLGIGSIRDNIDTDYSVTGSSFSIEGGAYFGKKVDGFSFAFSSEFSVLSGKNDNIPDFKEKDNLGMLAFNLYTIYSESKFNPYFGFGLVYTLFAESKATQISTGIEADLSASAYSSVGFQIKFGGKYYVRDDISIDAEYKLTNIDINFDKLNSIYYVDETVKNKISTLQLKLTKEF